MIDGEYNGLIIVIDSMLGRRSNCEKTISVGVFEQLLHAEVHSMGLQHVFQVTFTEWAMASVENTHCFVYTHRMKEKSKKTFSEERSSYGIYR